MNETFAQTFKYTNAPGFTSALAAVRRREWIVGSLDEKGSFSFSPNPATHPTEISAVAEANRLAAINPGKAYIAVRFTAGRMVPKVIGAFEF